MRSWRFGRKSLLLVGREEESRRDWWLFPGYLGGSVFSPLFHIPKNGFEKEH